MQELIYLSPTKLDRFVSERGRRRPPLTSLSIDRVASVTFGELDERTKREARFREVRSYIDESALWFTDPAVRQGDWVQFEGDLGYIILDTKKSRLFLMSQPSTMEGEVALLLHGSPRHVKLGVSKAVVEVEELDSHVGHLMRIAAELEELKASPHRRIRVAQWRNEAPSQSTTEVAAVQLFERIAKRHEGGLYVKGLAKTSIVVEDLPIFTYPPGADHSACLSRLVVASPLFIESVPRP